MRRRYGKNDSWKPAVMAIHLQSSALIFLSFISALKYSSLRSKGGK